MSLNQLTLNEVLAYLAFTISGMFLFAWIINIVCIKPLIKEIQKATDKTSVKQSQQYPITASLPLSDNDELNSIMATKLEELKKRYKAGEITDSEYIKQYQNFSL